MCQLIIHAKTLGDAPELSSQFYKLFGDEWSVTLERDKHEARLSTNNFQKPWIQIILLLKSMLMIWHGLASWLIERRLPLERVHFGYARPEHADEYDALFFAPVTAI